MSYFISAFLGWGSGTRVGHYTLNGKRKGQIEKAQRLFTVL
jgi:hypothetical protein